MFSGTFVLMCTLSGCQILDQLGLTEKDRIRRSGQVEMYYVDYETESSSAELNDIQYLLSNAPYKSALDNRQAGGENDVVLDRVGVLRPGMTWDAPRRTSLLGSAGESIRYSDDIVTIQVHGGFINSLPWTLTGSTDLVLFAEIWENAAAGPTARSLNSIVHISRSQMVPGRMNFEGSIAYGPTSFKGHPLKIKFTLIVFQRDQAEGVSSAADVLQNFATAAGAPSVAGILSSEAIGIVRQILRNQPDVEAFDFEATLMSDEPELLLATTLDRTATGIARANAPLLDPDRKARSGTSEGDVRASQSVARDLLYNLSDQIYWDRFILDNFQDRWNALVEDDSGRQWITDNAISQSKIEESIDVLQNELSLMDRDGEPSSESQDLLAHLQKLEKTVETSGVVNLPLYEAMNEITMLDEKLLETLYGLPESSTDDGQIGSDEDELGDRSRAREEVNARVAAVPRFNWLRYGTYALIETRPRDANRGHVPSNDFFWYKDVIVMGGSLVERPSQSTSTDGFQSGRGGTSVKYSEMNYILFSIVPRQLEQHGATLRAASEVSNDLLIRLSGDNTGSPANAVRDVVGNFLVATIEEGLTRIARRIAGRYPLSEFEDNYREAADEYIKRTLRDGVDGQSVEEAYQRIAKEIQVEIQERWVRRINQHRVRGDAS